MSAIEGLSIEVRKAKDGKYNIRNQAAVLEIIRNVESGHYAAVLGPRHNQKSLLLKDVKTELAKNGDWACVLVDLLDLRDVEEGNFLNKFATKFELQRKHEGIKIENPPLATTVTAEASSFKNFLEEHSRKIPKLVLLIDHLERIELEPLKSLLSTFLTLHKTHDTQVSHKLTVVSASSNTLELGLSSPSFLDIACPVWIRDMTFSESRELIRFVFREKGVESTHIGEQRFFDATKGDRYLLPILAEYCAAHTIESKGKVREQDANKVVDWFVNTWAKGFPPLRGNVRAVARDTIALMNVLKVLAGGRVLQNELMLDHKVDAYALRLTGVITVGGNNGENHYVIKNEFYERYLKDHFRPEHVPHILSMAGGWENAINYLDRLVADFPQYRTAILGKIIDFIRTADNESAACDYLIRQASQVFGLAKAKVYIVKPVRSHLEQRGQIGFDGEEAEELLLEKNPLAKAPEKDPLEIVAYKTQDFVVSTSDAKEHTILVPLLRNDGRSLGVVAIYDFKGDIHGENFLELLAYFKRAGRAVGSVIDRARESLQLRTLNETGQEVTFYLDKQKVMQATVQAAIKSVPGAQRGVLFLWRQKEQRLFIEAVARPELFETDVATDIILRHGEGYAGWVFAEGEQLRIGYVAEYPSLRYKDHPDIKKQMSVLCVPLKAWGRTIGVLCVDNIAAPYVFNRNDARLLSTFAAHAAIALQNSQVYTELYELGLSINSGTLQIPEIFNQTVQSITRITGAEAAHMLLLQDIDDKTITPAEKVVLSKSVGLGDDFDKLIEPRPDGLTCRVLRDRKYHAVRSPGEPPGINPLAKEKGTKAYICLPMEGPTSIIGVLFVYYMDEHYFTENEIEMLSLFSNQAALAIENTRQREKLEIMEGVTWMGIQFSDMAHSMRGELHSMKLKTGTLRELIANNAAAVAELEKLSRYINDAETILTLAPLPFRPTPIDLELNTLMRLVIPSWCPVDEKIKTDFKHLKKEDITIKADKDLLSIVLKILTTNAVRAMRSAPEKKLRISSTTEKGQAVVKVTNTGKEIPEEIRERLFKEPITKTSGASGTGVGLLIARSIMLRSGGELGLDKSDPTETTFSFTFPLSKAQRDQSL